MAALPCKIECRGGDGSADSSPPKLGPGHDVLDFRRARAVEDGPARDHFSVDLADEMLEDSRLVPARAEAERGHARAVLTASPDGFGVYERLGFSTVATVRRFLLR